MRKSIILGGSILCLFILVSLSYQPMFAGHTLPNDKNVELTIELIGYKNIDQYEVSITKENAIKLHSIIKELEDNVSRCANREEIIPIVNNSLNKLIELGLFQNKNIENIRNIIISNIIKSNDNLLQEHPILSQLILKNNDTLNLLCFMVGESDMMIFVSIFLLFLYQLLSSPWYFGPWLGGIIIVLFAYITLKPSTLLAYGRLTGVNLYSIGQLGFKHIIDNGTLSVTGFTGIKLYITEDTLGEGYLIGSAISIYKTDSS